jgi:hypothetical protein
MKPTKPTPLVVLARLLAERRGEEPPAFGEREAEEVQDALRRLAPALRASAAAVQKKRWAGAITGRLEPRAGVPAPRKPAQYRNPRSGGGP